MFHKINERLRNDKWTDIFFYQDDEEDSSDEDSDEDSELDTTAGDLDSTTNFAEEVSNTVKNS